MKFSYDGYDPNGKTVGGTVDATDRAEAMENLRRQGFFVTDVRANDSAPADAPRAGGRRRRLSKGKKQKNLAVFMRQLSVLVSSGTQLVQALMSLERQAKEPAWRDVVSSVRLKVEEGNTLSAAMEAHPEVFDAVCRSLISAGESGGGFEVMLDRLSVLTKKQMQIRSAIVGAMIYPALLIVIAINVLALMLLFVLPRFTGLFASLDVPLPPSTKFLMSISSFLRSYWWSLPIVGVVAFFGIRTWVRSVNGRRALDTIVLKLPLFGDVVRSFAMARITRVLGVLINGKVPLLDALALARQTVSNVHYVELVTRAEDAVTKGSNISNVFGESPLVNPSLVEAIRSGEQSGQMGAMLLNISDFLDEDNDVIVKSLTSILEPMILIVLGVVVGFIAISMFLPLFDLTAMANGGGGGG
jgi:type II secretory pathway component PulF